MKNLIIREAVESDVMAITDLFYNTIQAVCGKDYPQDEIDDWASWASDTTRWLSKIEVQYFIVATLPDNTVVGFASLEGDCLDYLYVHKDYQNRGIARKLLSGIERKAGQEGHDMLFSDVSITAKPFFEKNGFSVVRQQLARSKNKELINFRMEKHR